MIGLALALAATLSVQPDAESISFDAWAWGKQVVAWRVDPDGTVVRIAMEPQIPQYGESYRIITRTAPPNAGRYRTLVALLSPVRARANAELPCESPSTDGVSGAVHWGSIAKLNYYLGCYERDTQAVVATIMHADKQVEEWTLTAPVTETRVVAPEQ